MKLAKETAVANAKTFKNTKLFVAGLPQATVGLLAFPDTFGPESSRIKHGAEALGKLGHAVFLVDAADGAYIASLDGVDVPAWAKRNSFEKVVGGYVANVIAYLQQEVGYDYCWGAYIGAKQSALTTPVIKGHVSFHPSWLAEQFVNGKGALETMAKAIYVPCAAGNDPPIVREGGAVEGILKTKPGIGEHCSVVDFPDMIHGWVWRGNLETPR